MPLAEAVREQGARVQVAVGAPFYDRSPLPTALGTDVDPTRMAVPELTRQRFPAVVEDMATRWVPAFFGVMHALPAVSALRRAWSEDRPDLVVFDPANPGAAVVADEYGIPSMVFGVFHYFPPMLDLPAVTRRALDHPEVKPWSPVAEHDRSRPYIDPVPPDLQVGPVGDHPDVIPIRTTAWTDPLVEPAPLPARRWGRPLVYVTLGTVVGTPDVLRQVILESAEIGDVIASTGPTVDRGALGELPDVVVVRPFVRVVDVMASADLVVHHGGLGTTLASVARGLPQLLLPQVGDQSANAQAVIRAGIGAALMGARDDGAIRGALAALQSDEVTQSRVHAVAGRIASQAGPEQVARELLARLGRAETK